MGDVVVPEMITDPDTVPDTDPVPETADTRTDEGPREANVDGGVVVLGTIIVPDTDPVPEAIETALSVTAVTFDLHCKFNE